MSTSSIKSMKRVMHRSAALFSSDASSPMSMALSGCGWLTPFHLGVLQHLKEADKLKEISYFAGTSGGSIAALIACTTQDFEGMKEKSKELATDKVFFRDINAGLRKQIAEVLPANAAEMCNAKLHVVVSRLWPLSEQKCLIINKFHSNEDIIDALTASSYIP